MRIRRIMLTTASISASVIIAGTSTAQAAPPPPTPEQDSAEWTVTDGYLVKQGECTPDTPGDPESITWDAPGFLPWIGGSGTIRDTNPQLGGQFAAHWVPLPGYWDVAYLFC